MLSKYIRLRDGGICVTCGKSEKQGYLMNAGHYQPVGFVGSNNTLSWDERNIYCQCTHCNNAGQGQQELMAEHIIMIHGKKVLESLKARVRKIDPIKDWQAVHDHYKQKLSELSPG